MAPPAGRRLPAHAVGCVGADADPAEPRPLLRGGRPRGRRREGGEELGARPRQRQDERPRARGCGAAGREDPGVEPGRAPRADRQRHDQRIDGQGRLREDVRVGPDRRRDRRRRRARADRRRAADHRVGCGSARRESRSGRRFPRRQGERLRVSRRQGHEGGRRQGQPQTRERTAQARPRSVI